MENMVNPAFWKNRRVFMTGHTGFKGGWLTLWLNSLGSKLHGYALPPATSPSLYQVANIEPLLTSTYGDIRDQNTLARSIKECDPEIIFHLAAQPLVSEGYTNPVKTYATNVMGTVNLLDAARQAPNLRAVVVITTDKCYENLEWPWAYRENEALGGRDPYSNSKSCCELITSAYRQSFLADLDIRVATARAGNVLGGGDWSQNRLIPDLLAAFEKNTPATVRNPDSVRPWQHVLEPLAGYMLLAEALWTNRDMAQAWNFGPTEEDCWRVARIADRVASTWGNDVNWQHVHADLPHEASVLRLDSSLAKQRLGWHPRWSLARALDLTVNWHKAWLTNHNMADACRNQIEEYSDA